MIYIKSISLQILFQIFLTIILFAPGKVTAYDEFEPTGTFSNMKYDKETGDIEGYEIVIMNSDSGFKGTFREAAGEPAKYQFFVPIIENGMVSFEIESKSIYYPGKVFVDKFIGFYNENGISGTLSDGKGRIMDQLNLFRLPHKGIWREPEN